MLDNMLATVFTLLGVTTTLRESIVPFISSSGTCVLPRGPVSTKCGTLKHVTHLQTVKPQQLRVTDLAFIKGSERVTG